MTVNEFKASKRAPAFIGEAMPLIAALSLKRVGMQSQSPGTMGRWPAYTTGTCAKLSEGRQSRMPCKGSRNIAGSNSFE